VHPKIGTNHACTRKTLETFFRVLRGEEGGRQCLDKGDELRLTFPMGFLGFKRKEPGGRGSGGIRLKGGEAHQLIKGGVKVGEEEPVRP